MTDKTDNDFRDKLEDLVFETANGNTGKELDDGLDKVIALVREHDGKPFRFNDGEIKTNRENRANERQRCVDAAESVHNPCQVVSTPAFLRIRNDIIKAIQEADE